VNSFNNDRVISTLHIEVPHHPLAFTTFTIGDTVKVDCEIGFDENKNGLFLKARSIDIVSNTKIVIS
jgi:hypothetical protein